MDGPTPVRRALREREEALLTCHALADELDAKQGEIAGLEQEGSKARSKADLVRRPTRRNPAESRLKFSSHADFTLVVAFSSIILQPPAPQPCVQPAACEHITPRWPAPASVAHLAFLVR